MLANERIFRIRADGREFIINCSPKNLEELKIGLVYVEGLKEFEMEEVKVKHGFKIKSKEIWSMDMIRDSLGYIDINDPTKAHHIAVLIGKNGVIARAIDISRHAAVLKVIGMGLKKRAEFDRTYLLISSRITHEIALKCAKAGIPLIVTKKTITDLALEFCRDVGLSVVSFGSEVVEGDAVECGDTGRW